MPTASSNTPWRRPRGGGGCCSTPLSPHGPVAATACGAAPGSPSGWQPPAACLTTSSGTISSSPSACPPLRHGYEQGVDRGLVKWLRNNPSTNGRARPQMVFHLGFAQRLATDQKSDIRVNCCRAERSRPKLSRLSVPMPKQLMGKNFVANCEGFRMPACRGVSGHWRPASESLQGRNPRGPNATLGVYGDLMVADGWEPRWGRA